MNREGTHRENAEQIWQNEVDASAAVLRDRLERLGLQRFPIDLTDGIAVNSVEPLRYPATPLHPTVIGDPNWQHLASNGNERFYIYNIMMDSRAHIKYYLTISFDTNNPSLGNGPRLISEGISDNHVGSYLCYIGKRESDTGNYLKVTAVCSAPKQIDIQVEMMNEYNLVVQLDRASIFYRGGNDSYTFQYGSHGIRVDVGIFFDEDQLYN